MEIFQISVFQIGIIVCRNDTTGGPKSSKIAITVICTAVILGGLAFFVHFNLSDIEKNETRQESAESIARVALRLERRTK